MILSVAVVTGFKKEIRKRVIGFGSHIQIVNYDSNISYETAPIPARLDFLPELKSIDGIQHIQSFATKPGLVKTKDEVQGVIVKGIGKDFDWSFFKESIVEGGIIDLPDSTKSNDIVISKILAKTLNIKVGDKINMYFIDERPRTRRFVVKGIYKTTLEEFDKQFIIADLRHIQRLNNWEDGQISGFEISLDNYKELDYYTEVVRSLASFHFLPDGSRLQVLNIHHKYPHIFSWLGLLDMNVLVLLTIMLIVSIINMIAGLIIIILDKTSAIGIIKAIGADNQRVKNIFLYQAVYLIGRGLFWGNAFAIGIAFIQNKFQIIKLNSTSYFIDFVPININLGWLIGLNLASLSLIFIFMLLPVLIITRVTPAKTIRYE